MPSATFTLFQSFPEAALEKAHNLGSDSLVVALTNSAPSASANTQLSDITQISYTNLSARTLTTSSSSYSGATYKLVLNDLTLTASGGSVAAFRYIVIYNDTSVNDLLIGFLDYGSSLTLGDGDSLVLDFSAINGVLQATIV